MYKFGVYHQCYKNKKATEFAISRFRQYNPNTPYYLISDNGEDFSEIAKKYNCHFVLHKQNISTNYLDKEKIKILYERLIECFKTLSVENLLWMEDDVLCKKEVILKQNNFNILMSYVPGNKFSLYNKILKYNPNPNISWYGATGGTFLKNNIFLEEKNQKIIYNYINEDHESCGGSSDEFLAFCYLICGYECGINTDLGETHRTPDWLNSHHSLIHNFKEMYV